MNTTTSQHQMIYRLKCWADDLIFRVLVTIDRAVWHRASEEGALGYVASRVQSWVMGYTWHPRQWTGVFGTLPTEDFAETFTEWFGVAPGMSEAEMVEALTAHLQG